MLLEHSGHCQESLSICAKSLSHVPLFETPWTVAHQAPLSMGFSRQQYWSFHFILHIYTLDVKKKYI